MSAKMRHLVLMARRPAYGRGKRRLAAELGERVALRFQRVALAVLLRSLGRDRRWRLWLALTPDRPRAYPNARHAIGQGGGNLGARLARLARRLPAGPILFVGADAPHITRADIWAGFRALGRAEAVIGPTPDGGFWLIGLRHDRRRGEVFADVRWSSEHARADTLANLVGARVLFLRELEDVDDAASYARFKKHGRREGRIWQV